MWGICLFAMVYKGATVRQTEDGESVGPKMHSAVRLVGHSAQPSKNVVAKAVGPNGSQDYGYRTVNRCISKNLLAINPEHEDANPHGKGAVVLTDKGARYLNESEDKELKPEDYAPAEAFWSEVKGGWREY